MIRRTASTFLPILTAFGTHLHLQNPQLATKVDLLHTFCMIQRHTPSHQNSDRSRANKSKFRFLPPRTCLLLSVAATASPS